MRGYVAATELTSQTLRGLMPIAVDALVDLVHAFLPAMLEQDRLPQLAGAAGLATQRNCLQALQDAASERGVFIGRLFIGATIEHSAFHTQQKADRVAGRPTIDLPAVDTDHLAGLLFDMQVDCEEHELAYPPGLLGG